MEIITWNVNGVRAVAKKGLKEFILNMDADFYCLQEVKAFEEQFIQEIGYIRGYRFIWHTGEKPGYAGTAILYKEKLEIKGVKNVFDVNDFNTDGRVTQIEFNNEGKDIVLLNVYFPNGGTRADGTEMLSFKLNFYNEMINYVNQIVASGKEIIITGDFNICHEEIDIARPKENNESIGFLPIERAKITEFLNAGYIDTFREKYPSEITYSWWSFRAAARPRNIGWRLDYFVVNKDFCSKIKDTIYLTDVIGSDHCPVLLKF